MPVKKKSSASDTSSAKNARKKSAAKKKITKPEVTKRIASAVSQPESLYSRNFQPISSMPVKPKSQPNMEHEHPHRRLHHVLYVTEFARKIIWTLVALALVFVCLFLHIQSKKALSEYYHVGQADKQERILTLRAVGVADVVPDSAKVTMGLQTEAETVEEAQAQNTQVMNQLMSELEALGVEKKDIQTSNYQVFPVYSFPEGGEREVSGQQVSQQVTITISDTEYADQILALAGQLGLNSVGGLQFSVEDTTASVEKARQDALEKIEQKLKHIQKNVDLKAVSVVSYNEYEQNNGPNYPVAYNARFDAQEQASAPQIEAGSEEVRLEVVIGFEI